MKKIVKKYCFYFFMVIAVNVFSSCGAMENVADNTNDLTVEVSFFEFYRKFSNESGDFIELDLMLPELTGDFAGIPIINEFFLGKEQYFYDELGIGELLESFEADREIYPRDGVVEGLYMGWGRVAHYELSALHGNIISIYGWLWGGMGGVSWLGKEGHTFDLTTGKRLELSDIFTASEEQYMSIIYDFVFF